MPPLLPPSTSPLPPCHLALVPPCSDAGAAYDQVNDTLQRVLQVYIFHLIDTGGPALVAWSRWAARCGWGWLAGCMQPFGQGGGCWRRRAWDPCKCQSVRLGSPTCSTPSARRLASPLPAGAHKLVPLYACHLRAGLRHTTYQIFFEQLLAQVGPRV